MPCSRDCSTFLRRVMGYVMVISELEFRIIVIKHSGEAHSIFSEDGIWNAMTEHQEQAITWMRLGLDAIDK